MTTDQFETLRLYLIVFVVVFRLAMMPRYLQSYLNIAYYKMEGLKQEAGRISNVDIQKLIARVFYYLCVITLQYVAPMTMILFLSLMYKTMGGGSWTGLWADQAEPPMTPVVNLELEPRPAIHIETVFGQEEEVEALSGQFSLAWQSLKHVRSCFLKNYKVVHGTWLERSERALHPTE
jgi:hypothetical protein